MSDEQINPAGPWDPDRDAFILDGEMSGRPNLAGWRGALDTEHQRLSGMVHMTGYKLKSGAKHHDFYSVFGGFSQAASHPGGYNPVTNWFSVGYYATEMSLALELKDKDAVVWDSGPTSTVGAHQTGFNIGGNLSGGMFASEPIVQAGVSASFSASFSSPNVRFSQSMFSNHVQWTAMLPGVGFAGPSNPANPEAPSFAGYKWYFGAIFVIPAGRTFELGVHAKVSWNFDYTRGLTNDVKLFDRSATYKYVGGVNT
jgi:hypothetical protein